MGPEKTVRIASNQLMMAYNNTSPYSPEESSVWQGFQVSNSGKKYTPNRVANEAIVRATRMILPFVDYYPLKHCQTHLSNLVVEEVDASTSLSEAHANFKSHLLEFIDGFTSQGMWEVVFAVKGVDLNSSGAFTIGNCHFYLMDETQFHLWGRRYTTGKYDPPDNTVIAEDWQEETAILNQIVVTARVKAVDQEHARTKGRKRIEEAIGLLRYGQLAVGYPERPIPELGLWLRQWQHDHSFVMQIDKPNFGTNKNLAGPIGCDYSFSKRAPAWNELKRIVGLELVNRSELELRLMTVLKWIGQAAAAPADTIRLVSLVTALEALLIEESETLGKRSKLSSRIVGLTGGSDEEQTTMAKDVDDLYRVRSECVHAGLLDIEKEEVEKCVKVVRKTIEAILTKPPFATMQNLSDLIDHIEIDKPTTENLRRKWVEENAYFRWCDEINWVSKGCPPDRHYQHWMDAEREFNDNRVWHKKETDNPSADDSEI